MFISKTNSCRTVIILASCWISTISGTAHAYEPVHPAQSVDCQGSGTNDAARGRQDLIVPARILEGRIGKVPGIGIFHEKVSTTSGEAQLYYDQGMSFLYSYEWIRAAESFHESLRHDPALAMAYMGLSYAYSGVGENICAQAMERRAQELADRASPRERKRIELRGKQLQAISKEESGKGDDGYVWALDAALDENGDDIVLLLLRGNAAEGFATGMGQRGGQASIRYYERILQLAPGNFAAHHFLAHSYELMGRQDAALSHAQTYQKLAPAIPHAHHMYGHELMRVGQLAAATRQFEEADRLASEAMHNEPEAYLYEWHYRHNLSLLASAYRQAGNLKKTEQILRKMAGLQTIAPADEYYRSELAAFLLQTGEYEEAIASTGQLLKGDSPIGRAAGHALRGSAQAALQRRAQAQEELSAAEAETRALSPGWRRFLNPDLQMLRLQIALLDKTPDGVLQEFQHEEAIMRALPGTDAWSETLFRLEFIGTQARNLGEWKLAESTAEQLEQHAPDYFGTHRLLAEVALHRGDHQGYEQEMKAARKLRSARRVP